MQHGEREHTLMIEVARLRQETERLGSACIAWGARVDELSAALAAARRECDFMHRALLTIVSMVRGHPEYFAGEIFSCASEALAAHGGTE